MSNINGFESDEQEQYYFEIEQQRRSTEQAQQEYFYREIDLNDYFIEAIKSNTFTHTFSDGVMVKFNYISKD